MTILALLTAAVTSISPAEETQLRAGLEPLAFLAGNCWEGRFAGTGQTDRHCFSAVFDGMHLRDVHEVTGDGQHYAGETVYSWDDAAQTIRFTYWNSLGGVSTGTAVGAGDALDFPAERYTGPDGEEIVIETTWRRSDDDAYEALTTERRGSQVSQRRVRYVLVR